MDKKEIKINDKSLKGKGKRQTKPKEKAPKKEVNKEDLTKRQKLVEFLEKQGVKTHHRLTLNSIYERYKERYPEIMEELGLNKYNNNLEDDNDISDFNDELDTQEIDMESVKNVIENMKKCNTPTEENEKQNNNDNEIINKKLDAFYVKLDKVEKLIASFDQLFKNNKKFIVINCNE